jgi:hypothetical protein
MLTKVPGLEELRREDSCNVREELQKLEETVGNEVYEREERASRSSSFSVEIFFKNAAGLRMT